jgi:hypothetical protein
MSFRTVIALSIAGALSASCTLPRGTLTGGAVQDGALDDAWTATDDAGREDAQADAGRPPDQDAGPPCVERCSGNVAITCRGELPEDCGVDHCVADDTGARCEPRLCAPGSRACSADHGSALLCRDDGLGRDVEPCTRGCDDATGRCRPETACGVTNVDAIAPGETLTFDTCPWGDDWTLEPGDAACAGGVANSEDRMMRLNVAADGTYRIEVRDVDGSRRVDPVVYVRTVCADQASQFACGDDVDASHTDARLDVVLTAGDYFLVVDGYDYAVPSTDFTCGNVELAVTRL